MPKGAPSVVKKRGKQLQAAVGDLQAAWQKADAQTKPGDAPAADRVIDNAWGARVGIPP